MRYAVARYNQYQKETAYRIYCTECLRIITENTAKTVGVLGHGEIETPYVSVCFHDLLKPKKKDDRTAEQIAIDTIKQAGLEVAE